MMRLGKDWGCAMIMKSTMNAPAFLSSVWQSIVTIVNPPFPIRTINLTEYSSSRQCSHEIEAHKKMHLIWTAARNDAAFL